jgi:hypothetical protein
MSHKHKTKDSGTTRRNFVSVKQMNNLKASVDPTLKWEQTLKYLQLVANPETAELVSCPFGPQKPKSTVVRARTTVSFFANSNGETTFSVYDNRGPQSSQAPDHDSELDDIRENHLPRYGYILPSGPDGFIAGTVATCNTVASGPALTPALGSNAAVGSAGLGFSMSTPDLGIPMQHTVGKVIAQAVRIYPAGNNLNMQGTGYSFQTTDAGSSVLNGKNVSELYATQGLTVRAAGLANWPAGSFFRAVDPRIEDMEQNWLPCDWSQLVTNPSYWNFASSIWYAFAASGCTAGQPFRAEVYTIYEFANNTISYSRATNPPMMSPKSLAAFGAHARPEIEHEDNVEPHATAKTAQAMIDAHGPRKALGALAHAASGTFGEAAKKVASFILPKLVGMGASLLSDGLIPPQLAEAPVTLAIEGISAHEAEALGPASVPSRIDEPELVVATPVARKGNPEVPALSAVPPSEPTCKGKCEDCHKQSGTCPSW